DDAVPERDLLHHHLSADRQAGLPADQRLPVPPVGRQPDGGCRVAEVALARVLADGEEALVGAYDLRHAVPRAEDVTGRVGLASPRPAVLARPHDPAAWTGADRDPAVRAAADHPRHLGGGPAAARSLDLGALEAAAAVGRHQEHASVAAGTGLRADGDDGRAGRGDVGELL